MPARTHPHRQTTPTRAALFASLFVVLGISGCRNNCQELCQEMAAFAEEECNKTFPEEQIDQCLVQYDKENVDEKQDEICEDILPTLREEWTCDEVDDYFAGGGAAADQSGTTDG